MNINTNCDITNLWHSLSNGGCLRLRPLAINDDDKWRMMNDQWRVSPENDNNVWSTKEVDQPFSFSYVANVIHYTFSTEHTEKQFSKSIPRAINKNIEIHSSTMWCVCVWRVSEKFMARRMHMNILDCNSIRQRRWFTKQITTRALRCSHHHHQWNECRKKYVSKTFQLACCRCALWLYDVAISADQSERHRAISFCVETMRPEWSSRHLSSEQCAVMHYYHVFIFRFLFIVLYMRRICSSCDSHMLLDIRGVSLLPAQHTLFGHNLCYKQQQIL